MLKNIGHYQVRRKIGQGGMGVLYEAWDERLERHVAIQAIPEETESKEARSRFWHEARSLARVNHPHVCQVFDVLEQGGALVLVLELLDGQSLAERILAGMIATSEALRIEREILEALQALHDLGIVHRDLKPSNVFLTRHGIKLLDFGLARRTDRTFTGDPNLTRSAASITAPGLIVGTGGDWMKTEDQSITVKASKSPKKAVKAPEKAPTPLKKPTKLLPVKPL